MRCVSAICVRQLRAYTLIGTAPADVTCHGRTMEGRCQAEDRAITLKDGRVEQGNFDSYLPMRIDEVPVIETHLIKSAEARRAALARPRQQLSVLP
jgi:isoquinoline 1-oxidoreductase subunit beta